MASRCCPASNARTRSTRDMRLLLSSCRLGSPGDLPSPRASPLPTGKEEGPEPGPSSPGPARPNLAEPDVVIASLELNAVTPAQHATQRRRAGTVPSGRSGLVSCHVDVDHHIVEPITVEVRVGDHRLAVPLHLHRPAVQANGLEIVNTECVHVKVIPCL